MNPSHRAYCDVALAMHQRRNMSVAISLGLVGSTQPKRAPALPGDPSERRVLPHRRCPHQ